MSSCSLIKRIISAIAPASAYLLSSLKNKNSVSTRPASWYRASPGPIRRPASMTERAGNSTANRESRSHGFGALFQTRTRSTKPSARHAFTHLHNLAGLPHVGIAAVTPGLKRFRQRNITLRDIR